MFKNILQLYSLLICLISMIILLITSTIAINNITDLTLTKYKKQANFIKFNSNEEYMHSLKIKDNKISNTLNNLTPKEIEESRLIAKKNYVESIKGGAIGGLIDCASWLIVSLIFFIMHWKLYKRSEQN